MLAVAIMHLHHVVEGRMEEGKLAKHHCGGDMMYRMSGPEVPGQGEASPGGCLWVAFGLVDLPYTELWHMGSWMRPGVVFSIGGKARSKMCFLLRSVGMALANLVSFAESL